MNKNVFRALTCSSLLLALFMITGCASGPKFSEYAKTVPKVKQGEGRIWFYRPSGMGAAIQPAVMLNEQKVGIAQPKGFFYVDRPAGAYEVKCKTEWSHKCNFTLAPQDTKYVRLNMMLGLFVGHVLPREVPEQVALKQMQPLHLMNNQ